GVAAPFVAWAVYGVTGTTARFQAEASFRVPGSRLCGAPEWLGWERRARPRGGTVDTADLKSLGGNTVRVRVPPSAPLITQPKSAKRPVRSGFLARVRIHENYRAFSMAAGGL